MRPNLVSFCVIFLSMGALAAPAAAQRTIAYDTVSESTPAAVSCGFCAGEKFGVIFREIAPGVGLQTDEFPLTINSFKVAVASASVMGDGIITPFSCQGSGEGGTVGVTLEAYAGTDVPTGSIVSKPATGPWAGEMMVFAESVELERSIETTPGSRMYNVMINTIMVDGGVMVDAPNTYVRVVATIPSGGMSASCTALTLSPPGAVGIRDDDGRIDNEIGFIYALNPISGLGGIPQGWHWNESMMISDPVTGATGIGGDWLIRMDITPASGPPPDAGTTPDGGSTEDSGMPPMTDGGMTMTCTTDGECAGGERCESGMCVRVSCASATDCGGGMTCVEGRCRNLCSSDPECAGGEVCDTAAGYCIPVGSGDDGGCGCRVQRPGSIPNALLLSLGVLALLLRRRRR
jgi:MYXO-CTERM domain-containing protein